MPEGAIERLDAINARIQRHQQRLDHLARLREDAKREFAALAVNEALWRQTARIEALKEQEPWIAQLQGQIGELQSEIGRVGGRIGRRARAIGPEVATGLAGRRFRPKRLGRCGRPPTCCVRAASD